eukprot:1990570-Prymnesium_polylepis.2
MHFPCSAHPTPSRAPGPQITYVAQEHVMPDTPSEPLQHPMIDELFSGFDAAAGAYSPNAALRSRYPARGAE